MMRWLTRLAIAGLVAAAIGFLWSRLNQDYEDDLDDDIPLEFDVPSEGMSASQPSAGGLPLATADTGEGPGRDRQAAADGARDTASEPSGHRHDDLTVLRGVGPVFQQRLNEAGITTLRQLADADADALTNAGLEGVGVDLQSWIQQARELIENEPG